VAKKDDCGVEADFREVSVKGRISVFGSLEQESKGPAGTTRK
jgi:hypothetical protein